jgi:HK97 gp10 family phage protein
MASEKTHTSRPPVKYSQITGMSDLRRTLKKLPDDLTKEVRNELADVANATHRDAVRFAPYDEKKTSGKYIHLRDAIGVKASKDGLEIAVGLTQRIIGKRLWTKAGWRANFVLFGTKGGLARGRFKGARIPAQPANNFLLKAFEMNRQRFINRVEAAGKRAMDKANERGIL